MSKEDAIIKQLKCINDFLYVMAKVATEHPTTMSPDSFQELKNIIVKTRTESLLEYKNSTKA